MTEKSVVDDYNNNAFSDYLPEDDYDESTAEFEAQIEELRQTSETQTVDSEPSVNPFTANPVSNTAEYIPETGTITPIDETPAQDMGSLRSPIRPTPPPEIPTGLPEEEPTESVDMALEPIDETPDDPQAALEILRQKMEKAAAEFSAGIINKVQFGAIYKHYSDKRAIIERLSERDPDSGVWKQVAESGHTTFLRSHFKARAMFYAIFLLDQTRPLLTGGTQTEKAVTQINRIMKIIHTKGKPQDNRLARKAINGDMWLALAVGEYSVTFVVYLFQPSNLQMNMLEDMQSDFERANHILLQRGQAEPDRMVFPQRALLT